MSGGGDGRISIREGAAHPENRTGLWVVLQSFLHAWFRVEFDFEAYGVGNVPASGPALLASNHQSFLDPPALGIELTRPVSFMAKSELFENKYFSWLIRNLHSFPVKQGKGDRAAIMETVRRLQENCLVGIFVEGTRTDDGEISPLGGGTALVVRKAKVPLVPVVIDGSFEAWPHTRKLPRPGVVRVMYGPALKLWELPAGEVTEVLEGVLKEMLVDLRGFPAGGAGEPRTAVISPARAELVL